ncbi:hypothetical protein [Methylocapsa palsarum]|uniref:Uncharacterized protein n=1 Tax=Methylocapsa palsarum TaxID=1612308 RepID=A0A1I4B290_9HYPH|nr:hypothetical protein [Methylocapsa palsarum]SFK62019.1 hypothetical protein SAMN05444581_11258 [Methylocapsa palsarum]
MNTSLERIRAKIAELTAQAANLRIAERELLALDQGPARAAKPVLGRPPKATSKARSAPGRKAVRASSAPTGQPEARQSIASAITDVLGLHGALPAARIAEELKASGRDITNRTVSFSLQGLKKRRLVKSANGEWSVLKARAK